MCGIVGIFHFDPSAPVSESVLKAMCQTLVHRGPDDDGYFIKGSVGLAMRRLSVIDLNTGHQPQTNETGSCHIVFNGEIYNYPELQKRCVTHGHHLKTTGDTETILHLYEDLSDDCGHPLNGMFAFAIYDAPKRRLLLARDRLGIKPLYYAHIPAGLIFGSEIKALLAHPTISRTLDPVALDQYLTYKYIPGERTMYRAIRKLPPGHRLWISGNTHHIEPYWTLSFDKQPPRPEAEIAEELRERLKQSVKMQMLSDVPLGALLSGGIDSSFIVGLMSQLSNRPVKTFSIGFAERTYNELSAARQVATHFGTEHHEQIVRPNVSDLFDQVFNHLDEPFGDSSIIPTYLVSQLARQHVTVALSGTGADELFAGYERYWAIPLGRAYQHIPGWFRHVLTRGVDYLPSGHAKKGFIMRAQRFAQTANAPLLDRHKQIIALFSQTERDAIYHPNWLRPTITDDPLSARYLSSHASNDLDKLLDIDINTLLAEDYLVKDDRASMAVSLELRVPFLDHTLVEFAASLPPHLKLRRLTTKYILKKAAQPLLPQNILKRPKHGFEMPVAHWLTTDLKEHLQNLLSPQSRLHQILNPTTIGNLIKTHQTGRRNLSRQLWALMSLERWLQKEPVSPC